VEHKLINYNYVDGEFVLLRIVEGGVQTGSTRHRGHLLSYCACPGWLWRWRIIQWNEDWQGKQKYSEKTCPSATLSTTNPTWPDPGLNPCRRGGKPATNRLSYGAALICIISHRLQDLRENLTSPLYKMALETNKQEKKSCLIIGTSGKVQYTNYIDMSESARWLEGYCHVVCVPIDGVWIGDQIYWPLTGRN
jgi:hypothetical protein